MCRGPVTAPAPDPPFPWALVILLLIVGISEPISVTLLFPFAPVMVSEWVAADEVGVYAGLLASAYNFSGFLSNWLWGHAVDRVGPIRIMAILESRNVVPRCDASHPC